MRDNSLDAVKGFAVLLMIFCHALQLLGGALSGAAKWYCEMVNLVAYPIFLFSFGRGCALAYITKPYKNAAPRLLATFARLYAAYAISAFAALTVFKGEAISFNLMTDILLLDRLGPYSEFLIAFAIYALILLLAFPAIRALTRSAMATGIACALLFSLSLLPVSGAADTRLGLIIGMPRPACYPALSYAPYFLAGLLWETRPDARRNAALCALLLTLISAGYCVYAGSLPERFPPSTSWLMLSAIAPPALSLAASRLKWTCLASRRLCGVGSSALFYLLVSNAVFFAFGGAGLPACASLAFAALTTVCASFLGALFIRKEMK